MKEQGGPRPDNMLPKSYFADAAEIDYNTFRLRRIVCMLSIKPWQNGKSRFCIENVGSVRAPAHVHRW